jgi:hypothetical protein
MPPEPERTGEVCLMVGFECLETISNAWNSCFELLEVEEAAAKP